MTVEIFERWAIRHRPTGRYMPETPRRTGYTWSEPLGMGLGSAHCPRLFASKSAAQCALTWWLKGVTSVTHTRGDGWEIDADEYWETNMHEVDPEWMVERKAEDMEIVFVHLHCEVS